jgi:hypothetical protein
VVVANAGHPRVRDGAVLWGRGTRNVQYYLLVEVLFSVGQATLWRWSGLREGGHAGVVGVVGGKSLRKKSWAGRMDSWRLLASVCKLREEGRSVGRWTSRGGSFRASGGHMRKKLLRRNAQPSLLTPHSVHLQPSSLPRNAAYRMPSRCLNFLPRAAAIGLDSTTVLGTVF